MKPRILGSVAVLWAVSILGLVLLASAHGAAPAAQPELRLQHPGSRLEGFQDVHLADGTLTLTAERPGRALIVLYCSQALTVAEAKNATVTLEPGWAGHFGYSHYGVRLEVQAAGEVAVAFTVAQPRKEPLVETAEDFAAFQKEFAQRPSQFPGDADGFRAWQTTYRQKLAGWLMGGGLPQRVPLESRVVETKSYPAFTLRRVTYRSHADRTTELLLSLPNQAPPGGKAPLLLALHGHEADWGKADAKAFTSPHNDDFCAYFAERGWAVVQPATLDHKLQHAGWTLQGEWTWDAMVALDYAATVPEVHMGRVAVCGLSTGAHLAMNMLALDDRVRAGVVGCIFSTWNHYRRRFRIPPHCDCGITGQLGGKLEPCDWAALAAPKPVMYQHGRQDAAMCPNADAKRLDLTWNNGVLPQAEFDVAWAEVRRAYALAGTPQQCELRIHAGQHAIENDSAFRWLQR